MTVARPINILLPCPSHGRFWGDYHFGKSLLAALEDLGIEARIIYRPKWRALARFSLRRGVDLHVRGPANHAPRIWPWTKTVFWIISNTHLSASDRARARHVFVASPELASDLSAKGLPASVLLQCTDRARFSPDRQSDQLRTDVLFVGSRRPGFNRAIVELALSCGAAVAVWGSKWEGVLPGDTYKGKVIDNTELGAHYASASVVLNDHLPDMLRHKIASNRVFDVLASGTNLISDFLPDLGIEMPSARVVKDESEMQGALDAFREDGATERAARLALASHIRAHHSFHERAAAIAQVTDRL